MLERGQRKHVKKKKQKTKKLGAVPEVERRTQLVFEHDEFFRTKKRNQEELPVRGKPVDKGGYF